MEKPTTKFCWFCSHKLRAGGKYFTLLNIDGQTKTVHKACAKNISGDDDFHKVGENAYVSWCGADYVESY